MSERTCKRCGSVEFGIWGYIGVIGYSLLMGLIGYAFSQLFYSERIVIVGVVFAVIFMLPMWMISYHENKKELENNAKM